MVSCTSLCEFRHSLSLSGSTEADLFLLSVILEAGIYVSHIVWRIRYRKLRKEAKRAGMSIDDFLDSGRNDTETTQHDQPGCIDHSGEIEKSEESGEVAPDSNV